MHVFEFVEGRGGVGLCWVGVGWGARVGGLGGGRVGG